jgi:hypothetical protein
MLGLQSAIDNARAGRDQAVPTEQMFRALDGVHVEVDGDECVVEVFGVLDEAGRRYVQIALDGPHPRMFTVMLDPADDLSVALISLAA